MNFCIPDKPINNNLMIEDEKDRLNVGYISCEFCEKSNKHVDKIITSYKSSICNECILTCNKILMGSKNKDLSINYKNIMDILNKYVVGQSAVKSGLAFSIINHHYKISRNFPYNVHDNLLIMGKSGTGKTYLVSSICKEINIPMINYDCSNLTQMGYEGMDIREIIKLLIESVNGDITKAEKGVVFLDEFDKINCKDDGKDIGGRGVQVQLLRLIEGTNVSVELNNKESVIFNTKNLLFIFGGAFEYIRNNIGVISKTNESIQQKLIRNGFMKELVNRIVLIKEMEMLSVNDLVNILDKEQSIIHKFKAQLLEVYGITVRVSSKAIMYFAQSAFDINGGARGLNFTVTNTFEKIAKEIYGKSHIKSIYVGVNIKKNEIILKYR